MKQRFKSPTTAVLTGVLIAGSALLLPPLPAKADAVNEIHAKAGDQASVSLTAYADSPFYKKLPSYVSDSLRDGLFYYTGYYLEDGAAAGLANLTALHPTDTEDNSHTLDGDPVLAYCIEKNSLQERYHQDTGTLTKWSELKPHYNDNLTNALPKIGWIAKNGYPSKALDELEKQANAANGNDDATGSDHRDAVTATQAAIWHFSDDFTLKSDDITEYENGRLISVPDSAKKHISSLYNYLIKKAVPVSDPLDSTSDARGTSDFAGAALSLEAGQRGHQDRIIVPIQPISPAPTPTPTPTPTDHVKVTTTADQTAEVGKPFGDTAHITGTVPEGAHITFKLSHKGLLPNMCGDSVITTKPVAVPAGNHIQPIDIASPKVTVGQAGTYYWVETLTDSNGKVLAQGKCGEHAETTTVTAPVVPTPTPTMIPVGPSHPGLMPHTGV